MGTVAGTLMAAAMNFTAIYPLAFAGWTFPGYIALYTLGLNLAVTTALTPVFNAMGAEPADQTRAADYRP